MHYSDSSTLRRMGRAALAGNWQTALMVTLGASILNVALSLIRVSANVPAMLGARLFATAVNVQQNASQARLVSSLLPLLFEVVSAVLLVGMSNYLLHLHRGQDAGFSLLFSRFDIWWKCMGQSLWITLMILGCGLITVIPGLYLMILLRVSSVFLAILISIALILPMIVLSYRYAMAPYLLADHPDMGVMESIRKSIEIMYRNKSRLFVLQLSFIGWNLLYLGISYALGQLSPILGTAAGLAVLMALQTYMNSATAAFYLELIGEQPQPAVHSEGQEA